jgi:hypothetical protein
MNLQLEILAIQKFFRKEKQERFIGFVSSKKNRRKFISLLCHLRDLKWDLFQEVSSFDPDMVGNYTSNQTCYIISEDKSADQSYIPIDKIYSLENEGYAFILIFGEAEQVYYEGEPPDNKYISKRI